MLSQELKHSKHVLRALLISSLISFVVPLTLQAQKDKRGHVNALQMQQWSNNPLLILKPEGKQFFTYLYNELRVSEQADTQLAQLCKNVIQGLHIVSLHDCIDALVAAQGYLHNRKMQELTCEVFEDLFALTQSMNEDDQGRFIFGECDTRTLQLVNIRMANVHDLNIDTLSSLSANSIEVNDFLCMDSSVAVSTNNLSPKTGSIITIDGSIDLTLGNKLTINGAPISGGGTSFAGFSADADLDMNDRDINNIDNLRVRNGATQDTIELIGSAIGPGGQIRLNDVAGATRLLATVTANSAPPFISTYGKLCLSNVLNNVTAELSAATFLSGSALRLNTALGVNTINLQGETGIGAFFTTICTVGGTCMSDQRLKTDIKMLELDDTLDKLLTVSVRTFKMLEDVVSTPTEDQAKMYGFIGQELINVFPDVVDTSITMTLGGVEYTNLHRVFPSAFGTLAIAGIQALDKRFSDNARTTTFAADVLMTGNLTVDGTFTNPSDLRIKKELADIASADSLEVISKLQAKTYKLSEAFSGVPVELQPTQIGFVAQDVKQVMPEVVHAAQARGVGDQILEDFMTLDYARMVVHTANAAKCLKHQLDEKAEQLAAVEQKVGVLEDFKTFTLEQIAMMHKELMRLKKYSEVHVD